MRVLITGSRDWQEDAAIHWALGWFDHLDDVTVVSGACPTGADAMVEAYAAERSWTVERHPADWKRYGRSAGHARNAAMVKLGADVCLAWIRNQSPGATGCALLARRAGIPTAVMARTPGHFTVNLYGWPPADVRSSVWPTIGS